jgi:nucleoporin SEH1
MVKIWVLAENGAAPNSGRLFQALVSERSPTSSPYVSMSFKFSELYASHHMALIARDGSLAIFEASDCQDVATLVPADSPGPLVTPALNREDETSFKVVFEPSARIATGARQAGVEEDAISLAVAAMDSAFILRSSSATGSRAWYAACELKGHKGLVRDIDWAKRGGKSFDLLATACKDRMVRIYKITTPKASFKAGNGYTPSGLAKAEMDAKPGNGVEAVKKAAPSGIGAGLAGSSGSIAGLRDEQVPLGHGMVRLDAECVAELPDHGSEVWSVRWNESGTFVIFPHVYSHSSEPFKILILP